MRGFGAMCLLRKSWRVFVAPQCAALRCPWVSALVLPVVRVPSCARSPPGVLFTAHPHMYNKSVLQYCSRYIKNDHEPRTTKFHLIERIDHWHMGAEQADWCFLVLGPNFACSPHLIQDTTLYPPGGLLIPNSGPSQTHTTEDTL